MKGLSLFIFIFFISFNLHAFEKINEQNLSIIYPNATEIKPNKKVPEIFDVFNDGNQIGYMIINTVFSETIGYSGGPIKMGIGVDLNGAIQGIQILRHSEPIVLIGIPEKKLMKPFDKYIGFNVLKSYQEKTLEENKVDIVSGATVTIIVMEDGIVSSVLKAFRAMSIIEEQVKTEKRILKTSLPDEVRSWQQLLDSGAIKNLNLTVGQVSQAFKDKGFNEASILPESENPEDNFIDLYLGIVSIPEIGKNLLGKDEYKNLEKRIKSNQSAILVMANGIFSFRGSGFVRGGVFDRFQLEQGNESFRFRDYAYKRLRLVYPEGAPEFTEIGLFYLPEPKEGKSESRFKLTSESLFNLLISREYAPNKKQFYDAHLNYALPERYVDVEKITQLKTNPDSTVVIKNSFVGLGEDNARVKLIKGIWENKKVEIITVAILLFILTTIFMLQDQLVKHARLTKIVRYSFLTFVLIWLGFINNAQLSVVNVFIFLNAFVTDFNWNTFLIDPMVFIIWCGVAAGLILWARGAYCGWLCPFGALQELTNHIARKLKVPQITLPWGLHERLWAIKYILFLVLLGVSMYSIGLAEKFAEVEPFKTSIILKFQRTWPFVAYALALLTIGLFIERFFCRYLCPLGGGLAIPAKLKLFDWIKRYPKDCGSPCQVCAKECMVQAIHPEGNINANECINCLHCQILYVDDKTCPVMVKKRKKKEKRSKWSGESQVDTNKTTEIKIFLKDVKVRK